MVQPAYRSIRGRQVGVRVVADGFRSGSRPGIRKTTGSCLSTVRTDTNCLERPEAPTAPHCSVGLLDAPGEARRIHEGGRFETLAEGLAEAGEARKVGGKRDSDAHELLRRVGGQFRKAEVGEQGEPCARGCGVADEVDDGNPHPEGVEAGGLAGVGERVESDVDAVVQFEVRRPGLPADEGHTLAFDPCPLQQFRSALACGAVWCKQNQPRAIDGAENPCPERQDEFVDLAEIVEAAECDLAAVQGRQGIHGRPAGERVVAPEGIG